MFDLFMTKKEKALSVLDKLSEGVLYLQDDTLRYKGSNEILVLNEKVEEIFWEKYNLAYAVHAKIFENLTPIEDEV